MLVNGIPQYLQNLKNEKVDLTTANATTLYTVPTEADFNASVISSLLVCNDSGSADTITVTLVGGGTFSLFNVTAVSANTTVELLTKDLVLNEGEILKVQAATADRLHVVASIQEFAKTRITTSAISGI
jgi:hypothetical protein|tara:strand:+ start:1537 stop:1923 length:387 start_codon:yes stop_codon:yes gene_type:complete